MHGEQWRSNSGGKWVFFWWKIVNFCTKEAGEICNVHLCTRASKPLKHWHDWHGSGWSAKERSFMIRKLKNGGYRLYSSKRNPDTGERRNLGTFQTLDAAKRHERQVQFFKRH